MVDVGWCWDGGHAKLLAGEGQGNGREGEVVNGYLVMPSAEGMQAGVLAPERSAQFHPILTGRLLTFATYAALQVQN